MFKSLTKLFISIQGRIYIFCFSENINSPFLFLNRVISTQKYFLRLVSIFKISGEEENLKCENNFGV